MIVLIEQRGMDLSCKRAYSVIIENLSETELYVIWMGEKRKKYTLWSLAVAGNLAYIPK